MVSLTGTPLYSAFARVSMAGVCTIHTLPSSNCPSAFCGFCLFEVEGHTALHVLAGRIANRLDFGGVNFTVDAACGSSLAAITLATQELESGRSNVAIAGGVDTVQGPFGYLCFSKTQALSPQGKARAFDRDADGVVISEGVCVTVMKRLADAERDGGNADRIKGLLRKSI